MSLTKLAKDLSIISKLSDEPNDTDGLTADELKAKFDEAGNSIKDYLNNTLTLEMDNEIGESYKKPGTGIPKTDLASDVQTSLGKADTAYVKPNTGIPKTDLASDVQTSLGKADTALQAGALPAGGTDGDVLVKNGATDYDARWTKTPPQMGSLATIEPTSTVTQKTQYVRGDYLVYNGQLYKVTASTISQGETLNPGQGGNIEAVSATTAAKNESIDAVRVIDYDITNLTIGANGYVAVSSYRPSTPAGYGVLLFTVKNATYSGNYAFPVIDGNGYFMYGSPNFTYRELNCRAIYKRV